MVKFVSEVFVNSSSGNKPSDIKFNFLSNNVIISDAPLHAFVQLWSPHSGSNHYPIFERTYLSCISRYLVPNSIFQKQATFFKINGLMKS